MSTALEEALSDLLYEGPMDLVQPSGRQRKRSTEVRDIPTVTQLPMVRIGRPRTWVIDQLVSNKELPVEVKVILKNEMLFVVRLACSFRPQGDEVRLAAR